MKGLFMKMPILDAQDRARTLQHDYLLASRAAGYGHIALPKPHIAIGHVLARLDPHYLKSRTEGIIQCCRVENFEKREFNEFMREAARHDQKLLNKK